MLEAYTMLLVHPSTQFSQNASAQHTHTCTTHMHARTQTHNSHYMNSHFIHVPTYTQARCDDLNLRHKHVNSTVLYYGQLVMVMSVCLCTVHWHSGDYIHTAIFSFIATPQSSGLISMPLFCSVPGSHPCDGDSPDYHTWQLK